MIYVFYNVRTLEIITIMKPILNNINIDEFIHSRIKYDDKCKDLSFEDIKYTVEDSKEYDYYCENYQIKTTMYIDPDTKRFVIKILDNKEVGVNPTYNAQKFKREYTVENMLDMYHNDYINFNLKNVALSNNGVEVGFKYLSELNIRTRMTNKPWKSFYADPYLTETAKDKLLLGRSIKEMGTYYPIILCKSDLQGKENIVLEGTHRISSLKLLQAYGELPEDHRILCITLPIVYERIHDIGEHNIVNEPVKFRNIIEVGYGSEILNDKTLYEKTIESIASSGRTIINEYTYEYLGHSWKDLLSGIDMYPHWLRDLIYNHKDEVKPSIIINNEEAFKSWLEG